MTNLTTCVYTFRGQPWGLESQTDHPNLGTVLFLPTAPPSWWIYHCLWITFSLVFHCELCKATVKAICFEVGNRNDHTQLMDLLVLQRSFKWWEESKPLHHAWISVWKSSSPRALFSELIHFKVIIKSTSRRTEKLRGINKGEYKYNGPRAYKVQFVEFTAL